ncbi:MAG: ABC transporter ATP-binding protein [Acidobacteriota bacterium]|nr:ABC transporter ATP-binding protein [Acidobacteriota bacterium]
MRRPRSPRGAGEEPDVGGDPGSGPIVSIEDLQVSFVRGDREISAVRGVSLGVERGEIVGLVGESGSGKSVLGLSLLGLLPTSPSPRVSGRACVAGTDMVAADAETRRLVRRRHMGAVFQDPMTSLNPTMRVGRQVAEAAAAAGQDVASLLDSVGIPDARRRMEAYPHELSGGLRQRVMIAMAIAGNPSLVIADEPTTALDVTVQAQILELIRRLCDGLGTSFILVTHDLGVAAQVSDRIAVLYGGRLAEVGPATSIFEKGRHPYTAGLLRSRLVLDTDRTRPVLTLPGEPPDPRSHPPGCPFSPRCERHRDDCDVALPELGGAGGDGADGTAVACLHPVGVDDVTADEANVVEEWPAVPASTGGRDPAVIVHDVHKDFPLRSGLRRMRLQALRGVSLEIERGESVALVGESGCGKSTLLRAVAGLHGVDRGEIEFSRGMSAQMVFQDAGASLTPWLSIGELIGERLRGEGLSRAERAAKVSDALALVGLPAEVAAARPAQLSGGQRQRVALARATVVPPGVLLCDEPTSALDVSLAATVLNLIGRLRRQLGMAVLFVTHDLAAARIVADRIAVMYLGRIVETGPSEQVCGAPAHPYTKALLSAVPERGRTGTRIGGEPANPLDPPTGCSFHTRCPDQVPECANRPQVLVTLGTGPGSRTLSEGSEGLDPGIRQVACSRLAPPPEPAVSRADGGDGADGGTGADGGDGEEN